MAVSGELRKRIREELPAFAWLIDVPEVGDLLGRATTEGWDITRLQGQLYSTKWWKTQSESMRNWQTLRATDPASANQQHSSMVIQVRTEAGRIGASLSDAEQRLISEWAMQRGWGSAEISHAVMNVAQKNGRLGQFGAVEQGTQELRAWSGAMGLNLPGNTLKNYAIRIAKGDLTLDGVKAQFTASAKARYKNNSSIIRTLDAGGTVMDAMQPVFSRVAEELELGDTTGFDLAKGWGKELLNYRDPATKEWRAMNEWEASEWARRQPRWLKTRNGRDSASEAAAAISTAMGRRTG